MFSDNELVLKEFTKERSEMLFSGFKALQKRGTHTVNLVLSTEAAYEYEN